jgi:hypothetical protein
MITHWITAERIRCFGHIAGMFCVNWGGHSEPLNRMSTPFDWIQNMHILWEIWG